MFGVNGVFCLAILETMNSSTKEYGTVGVPEKNEGPFEGPAARPLCAGEVTGAMAREQRQLLIDLAKRVLTGCGLRLQCTRLIHNSC